MVSLRVMIRIIVIIIMIVIMEIILILRKSVVKSEVLPCRYDITKQMKMKMIYYGTDGKLVLQIGV